MHRGPVALLASLYACAITLWVVGLTRGWTTLGSGEWIYAFVLALYASLSVAALRQRPDDARARIFVLALGVNTLTIVWPTLDLGEPSRVLFWPTMIGGSFLYALPLAVFRMPSSRYAPCSSSASGSSRVVAPSASRT